MFAAENISDVFVHANQGYSRLSEEESVQLFVFITIFLFIWENAFFGKYRWLCR